MTKVLADRLKVAREKAGMTQRDLAEKAGVSEAYVSMIETQTRQPHLDVLLAFAAALGVGVGYFFESGAPSEDLTYAPLVAFAKSAKLSKKQIGFFVEVGKLLFRDRG